MTMPDTPDLPTPIRSSTKARYLWIVGVAAYLGFLAYVGWADLRDAIADIHYRFLGAVIVLDLLVLWFRVSKWHLALHGESDVTRLAFLSKAGGNLTPGRLGEFSPLLMQQFRTSKVGAWIFLDRMLEAIATLMLGLVGIIAVVGLVGGYTLLYASLALMVLLILGSYMLMQDGLIAKIQTRCTSIEAIHRLLGHLRSVSIELALLRPKVPLFLGMSLIATAFDILLAYFLCLSLGFTVSLTLLALVQVVHAVTSVIPLTPNATGIPYAAAATILHQVGDVSLEALAVIVALRMLLGNAVFWVSFLIGIRTKPLPHPHED